MDIIVLIHYIYRDIPIYCFCQLGIAFCFRPNVNPSPNSAVYSAPKATKDMEGSYLCRAKNAAGESEDLIQIIVNENGGNDGGRGMFKYLSNRKIITVHKYFSDDNICGISYLITTIFVDIDPNVRPCCRARTAECLACTLGQTVQQYCQSNPQTVGCEGNYNKGISIQNK